MEKEEQAECKREGADIALEEKKTEADVLRDSLQAYVSASVENGSCDLSEDESSIVIAISGSLEKESLWEVVSSSVWRYSKEEKTLRGELALKAAYCEDGVTSFVYKKTTEKAIEAVSSIGDTVQGQLEEYLKEIPATCERETDRGLMCLRRPLPVTKTTINWERFV
ncbi:MAG: F-actin capping protein alpha subunit [Amphiamblys sp. WSBS2006]|nr:MAG: F-actin capping protein alpha subunit [Amphiamblys sp. WSBS2006]